VGALARAELEGAPPAQIERFRTALCGPCGSVGDRLVWAAWLPFCSLLALTAFGLGAPAWAVLVLFLAAYNAGHLALRAWGISTGWRLGMRVAPALGAPVLRYGPAYIARAGALLAGVAVPLVLRRVVGADRLPLDELASRGLVLTNGGDNFARPMAEWVMLAVLAAAKHFPEFVRRSDAGRWDPSPALLAELEGAVLLLLGFGAVGRQAAEMARPFGMDVRAVARTPREPPAGVSRLVTGAAWRDELPQADYVVCAMPLTRQTRGMVDAAALAAMKPTAWLVNVARGALVDEEALVGALDAGRLGGAVLDAFTTEPLPEDHPLWRRPNVVVVPHHTWSSPRAAERAARLFAAELARFAAGQPLQNRVDPDAGY
jgi:phosphoglycerate dehydrogenase-like enzyme